MSRPAVINLRGGSFYCVMLIKEESKWGQEIKGKLQAYGWKRDRNGGKRHKNPDRDFERGCILAEG
jgi:hypothetical protein